MNRKKIARIVINLLSLLMLCLMVSGCAFNGLRCHESMHTENKIENIALFSEGAVAWFGPGIIDVSESRKALEVFHEINEQELLQRGYSIGSSYPARANHFNRQNVQFEGNNPYEVPEKYIVFEDYRKDRNKILELTGNVPAYENPMMQENEPLRDAVYSILTDIELASVWYEVKNENSSIDSENNFYYKTDIGFFQPDKADITTIRESINADTICFAKMYGRLNSAGAIITNILVGAALFGVPSSKPNQTSVFHMCIDAETGEVLWQRFSRLFVTPEREGIDRVVKKNLLIFPQKGKPLDVKCSMNN